MITRKDFIDVVKSYINGFHPVVPFDSSKDKLLLLDFTEQNKKLTEDLLKDTQAFSAYINHKLKAANAKYGIGGYAEHRTIYSRSELFSSPVEGEGRGEVRRFHLGIDIWGRTFTKVMAPLDGVVHSFAFNNGLGNYGATVIVTHNIDGHTFHTLYGHLSLNSLKNLYEGQNVRKGDVLAEFGPPAENGQWPPHLHFQIVLDMQGMKGDYPGVCAFSEKEKWLVNCPDPDLVLNMMQYVEKV